MITKEFLEVQYWQLNKSLKEIGNIVGCSDTKVLKHMIKHGVPRRKDNPRKKFEKILTKNFLKEEYEINKKTSVEIADHIGCDLGL